MQRRRPDWDSFFMGLALTVSKRSLDPHTQVGAVLIDEDNIIVGMGYNSFPRGLLDSALPTEAPEKYLYMVHAEMNALANCQSRPKGATLYVTLEPCNVCAMQLINSQIAKIRYLLPRSSPGKEYLVSREILRKAGVDSRQFKGSLEWLRESPTVEGVCLLPPQ